MLSYEHLYYKLYPLKIDYGREEFVSNLELVSGQMFLSINFAHLILPYSVKEFFIGSGTGNTETIYYVKNST